MKLPLFDFDDSYPLTLGVADDYFTLSQRLKRLGRAPKSPRKRALYLFGAALLVSFVAVVPFRLTARAQNEAKLAQLSGTVKDASGQAVAGATVYLARRNSAEPLETTDSDRDGRYEFSSEIGENRSALVWADAGARGLGQAYISQSQGGARIANPIVAPPAPVKLLLVAPDGTRAANLRVRVGQIGPKIGEQWVLPRPLAQKLQTQTNARGEAVFAGLPTGQIAQFWLNDQKFYQTQVGFGDLRGGQYAPLGADESVKVGKAKGWKTIRLLAPVTLRGRITTPAGIGKSGVLVTAQTIFNGSLMTAQTRADSNGDYEMKGLRPSLQLIEVEPEAWLARDYVSRTSITELRAPLRQLDLPLIRGGIIRGTIRQKDNKKPLAGQTVSLLDAGRKYRYQKTDARGRFQFRAVGDWAFVWTQTDKIPTRFFNTGTLAFEAKKLESYEERSGKFVRDSVMTDAKLQIRTRNPVGSPTVATLNVAELIRLPVKEGATREITLEIPAKNLVTNATLSGQVSRPNGTVARARVVVRPAADTDYKRAVEKPTDARGRYSIAGLKPGRYKISAQLDDATKANWAAPKLTQTLEAGANRADIKLARGALITGVVWAKSNHHAIAGVEVLTADEDGDGTIETTKSNGVFRFRVAPGRVAVRLHQSSTPPPGYALTRQELIFNAKEGGAMHTIFELPPDKSRATNAATVAKAVTGTVMGPNGKPTEYALITIEGVSPSSPNTWRGKARTDDNGRFEVPAKLVKDGARLFARDGADADLVTARGTVVRGGDDVTLQLEANVYGTAQGQITDEKTGQPLEGVNVICHAPAGSSSIERLTTGADGRFRFDRLRPFQQNFLQIGKRGYEEVGSGIFVLQKNETKRLTIALPPHDKTLSGRVTLANGKSAGAGYKVMVSTGQGRTQTKTDGSFVLGQVLDKKFVLTVIAPDAKKVWTPYWTRGGRSNVTLQLTDARLQRADAARSSGKARAFFNSPKSAAATATGTIAGTVRDEREKPLAGIKVWAYAPEIYQFNGPTFVTTKANGKYRFENFPVGGKFAVIALPGNGYSTLPAPNDNVWGLDFRALAAGQTQTIDVTMRAAPAILAGQVLQPDGSRAIGYHVSPRNMKRTSATVKANGKFWLAGVWSGPRDVYVTDAMSRKRWGPYRAADNQRDLVLRLSERTRDKNYVLGTAKQ